MAFRTGLIAAAVLVASAGIALAGGRFKNGTVNISIDGTCDTLTLTDTNGVIVGQSNAPNGCDDGYEIGYVASQKLVNPGSNEAIVGSDLGLSPDAWVWSFNFKTLQAVLTGTRDGQTADGPLDFLFTYTRGDEPLPAKPGGLPTATSAAIAASKNH